MITTTIEIQSSNKKPIVLFNIQKTNNIQTLSKPKNPNPAYAVKSDNGKNQHPSKPYQNQPIKACPTQKTGNTLNPGKVIRIVKPNPEKPK